MTTIVRAARVLVDGRLRPAEVEIEGGIIAAVRAPGDAPSPAATPADVNLVEVPDDTVVLPGNVDTHVHVNEPGRTHWEGYATATRAAAAGGATTILDMPLNSIPPTCTVDALDEKQAAAAGQCSVDVGFWGGSIPGNGDQLAPLWARGVFGFKSFLSPSGVDEFPPLSPELFEESLRVIGSFGGLQIVHAEDPGVLGAVPGWHSAHYADYLGTRTPDAEAGAIATVVEAVRRTGTRAHVLHVSSAAGVELIAKAKAEGLPVTAETCPHYLTLDAETIPDGATQFKCCPPIRERGERDALWDALVDGVLDIVVSDHSPATADVKLPADGDFATAWGGVSGLEAGLAAMWTEASRRGIGLERVSSWMAARPAELMSVARKGRIAPGYDADLTFFAPEDGHVLRASSMQHRNKLSAYDGFHASGRVHQTWLRGRKVYDLLEGGLLGRPSGTFLTRP